MNCVTLNLTCPASGSQSKSCDCGHAQTRLASSISYLSFLCVIWAASSHPRFYRWQNCAELCAWREFGRTESKVSLPAVLVTVCATLNHSSLLSPLADPTLRWGNWGLERYRNFLEKMGRYSQTQAQIPSHGHRAWWSPPRVNVSSESFSSVTKYVSLHRNDLSRLKVGWSGFGDTKL